MGKGLRQILHTPLYTNAFYLIVSSVASSLLGFAFWIVAARYYPATDVGLASALFAAIGLLSSFSLFGFNIALIRFLPEEGDRGGMISSCLTITGACSIILAAIFIVGLPLWSPKLLLLQGNLVLLTLFIIFTAAMSLVVMQSSIFIALRSTWLLLTQQVLSGILRILLAITLVTFGVLGIFSSWGIAICIALLVGSLFIMKIQPSYRPFPAIKKGVISKMLRFSVGNYVAEVVGSAQFFLLPLIILSLLGAEATAYFRIAYGVSIILFMIPNAINRSLFAEGSHEPDKLRSNVIRAVRLMFFLLIPALAVIFFFGDKILLLFGREYSQNALQTLWLLSLSALPLAINELYIVIRRVQLRTKAVIYTYLSIATITIAASYILIPKYGLIGVGMGWVLGEGLVAIVCAVTMMKRINLRLF